MGTADDARVFAPAGVAFETGKLYRLVLHNPSKVKHYFSSPGLADRVFTRKVEVKDASGEKTIGEIKGAIREMVASVDSLELLPRQGRGRKDACREGHDRRRPSQVIGASRASASSSVNTRLRVRKRTPSGASSEKPEPRPGTTSIINWVCFQ
jgi:hypothetical protein